jgi:uncharacterized ion transporter superfamily protein YfcC
LKYTLVALLLIDITNLIVIIPTAVTEEYIRNSSASTPPPDESRLPNNINETEADFTRRRVATLAVDGSTIFFLILGLVGVAKENLYISAIAAIVMTIETIASLVMRSSPSSFLTTIFDGIVSLLAYLYAFMCHLKNKKSSRNQIVPLVNPIKAPSADSGHPDSANTDTVPAGSVYLTAPDP